MNTYIIPLSWEYSGALVINAESLAEATEKAFEMPRPEGIYIEDSWKIDEEHIEVYSLKDHCGRPIIPSSGVLVFQNPDHVGSRYAATVVKCTKDPITVVDGERHSHTVPACYVHVVNW